MNGYIIELFYSEEDEGYIAVVPKLPGCSAFGKTRKEALQEIEVAVELRLEVMKSEQGEMEKSNFSLREKMKSSSTSVQTLLLRILIKPR